jgi:hypothetical protein
MGITNMFTMKIKEKGSDGYLSLHVTTAAFVAAFY